MPFKKGQSGNPSGRPPKKRALTDLLESTGNKTIEIGGKKVKRAAFLASAIWEAITEKTITFPDSTKMIVGTDDWWNAVEFLYKQIDGPPKSEHDITSDGQPVSVINVTLTKNE